MLHPDELYAATLKMTAEVFVGTDWPDLRAALEYMDAHDVAGPWVLRLLPALCCAAVGGDPQSAIALCAAGRLYVLGAMLLDDAADGDAASGGRAWRDWSTAQILNVGAACNMSADMCLARGALPANALSDLGAAWLQAMSAQAQPPQQASDLNIYYRYVAAKSGLAFATLARLGAQVGSSNADHWRTAFDYGMSLGVLRQLRNDAGGWGARDYAASDFAKGLYTLPLVCALALTAHPQHGQLVSLLATGIKDESGYAALRALVNEIGGVRASDQVIVEHERTAMAAAQNFPQKKRILEGLIELNTTHSHEDSNGYTYPRNGNIQRTGAHRKAIYSAHGCHIG